MSFDHIRFLGSGGNERGGRMREGTELRGNVLRDIRENRLEMSDPARPELKRKKASNVPSSRDKGSTGMDPIYFIVVTYIRTSNIITIQSLHLQPNRPENTTHIATYPIHLSLSPRGDLRQVLVQSPNFCL